MPTSALRHVDVDYTLRIAEMPALLESLTHEVVSDPPARPTNGRLAIETRIALEDNALELGMNNFGEPAFFTCPTCNGSMISLQEGSFRRFRCHTGHAFTPVALARNAREQVERTLFSAMAHLEEHEVLLLQMEQEALVQGRTEAAARLAKEAKAIRQLVLRTRELAMDPALSVDADET
jgi:two-component system chemotaxis response regulator CheB